MSIIDKISQAEKVGQMQHPEYALKSASLDNLIVFVTRNLIGSFDFSKVPYIVYSNLPLRHNAFECFGVKNITSRHAKSVISFKIFFK
jgi:hypothetical protein